MFARIRPQSSLFRRTTTHQTLRNQRAFVTAELIRPFNDTLSVRINEEEGGEDFNCDEEPHFLKPELGFGFNPLKLGEYLEGGEALGGTYQVVRKLGFGANSTVWLANFTGDSTTEKRYLAVKVLTVNMTAGVSYEKTFELLSITRVTKTNRDHPGYQHSLTLLDCLLCDSHHGPHICLVTDVLGSNIMSLQREQPNRAFSTRVTKRIIKQVLLALDYLHRECGLVHTDVKPQNIMVSMKTSAETISAYLNENPSSTYEPRIEPDLSPDPIITVRSQPLPNFGVKPSLDDLVVKLADYGETVPIEKITPGDGCQPVLLRAPEVRLGSAWSTPIDIWSVGCLVYEHLTGAPFFDLYESPSITVPDSHLQRMIEQLGSFPESFLEKCSLRNEYFNEPGELLRVKKLVPRTIEERIALYKHVDKKDIGPAAGFMRRCLTIDPSARPSASELLQDEWLSDV